MARRRQRRGEDPQLSPATAFAPTLNTLANSTFGNQIIGNTTPSPDGNAFHYNIKTGAYRPTIPGRHYDHRLMGAGPTRSRAGKALGRAVDWASSAANIYDQSTGVWTGLNHPGAVFTISKASPAAAGRGKGSHLAPTGSTLWPVARFGAGTSTPRPGGNVARRRHSGRDAGVGKLRLPGQSGRHLCGREE